MPVERVSWTDARMTLLRFGFDLPTEAQWEYAARAGAETPFSDGEDALSLIGAANLSDLSASLAGAPWPRDGLFGPYDDGFIGSAPVGGRRPNRFGLHDVHGNVAEWCRDGFDERAGLRYASRDPLVPPGDFPTRSVRGGAFDSRPRDARCAARAQASPSSAHQSLGLRLVTEL